MFFTSNCLNQMLEFHYNSIHLLTMFNSNCREGVQFMFDCVSGLSNAEGISGCILADDMG